VGACPFARGLDGGSFRRLCLGVSVVPWRQPEALAPRALLACRTARLATSDRRPLELLEGFSAWGSSPARHS